MKSYSHLFLFFLMITMMFLCAGCATSRLPADFKTIVRPQNAKLGLGSISDESLYDDEAIYLQQYIQRTYPNIFYDCVLMDLDYTNEFYDVDVIVKGTINTRSIKVKRRSKTQDVYNFELLYTDTGETSNFQNAKYRRTGSASISKANDYIYGWDIIVYEVCKGLKMRNAGVH